MRRVLMVKGGSHDGVNRVYVSFCVCINCENGVLCVCAFLNEKGQKPKKEKNGFSSLFEYSVYNVYIVLFQVCVFSKKWKSRPSMVVPPFCYGVSKM